KCAAQFVMTHRAVPVQECLIGLNEVRLVCKMSVCGSRELGQDLAERLRAFLCVVRPCADDRQQQVGLEVQHEQTAVTSSLAMPAGDSQSSVPMATATLCPQLHAQSRRPIDPPTRNPVLLELLPLELGLREISPLEGAERQSEVAVDIQRGQCDGVLDSDL